MISMHGRNQYRTMKVVELLPNGQLRCEAIMSNITGEIRRPIEIKPEHKFVTATVHRTFVAEQSVLFRDIDPDPTDPDYEINDEVCVMEHYTVEHPSRMTGGLDLSNPVDIIDFITDPTPYLEKPLTESSMKVEFFVIGRWRGTRTSTTESFPINNPS